MKQQIETAIQNELCTPNLGAIVTGIRSAYREADSLIRDNSLLNVRNRAMTRGQLRYHMVQNCLWRIHEQGLLDGIAAKWEPVSSALDCLTLETPTFFVESCHLADPDEKPKSSVNRTTKIISNQAILPSLVTLFDVPADSKIHLFLLHGSQNLHFIHFACLDSTLKGCPYLVKTSNHLLSVDTNLAADEVIREFSPSLKDEAIQKLKRAANE